MATLALPLSILDGSGTASSIARYTDGNATPPKSLVTLGATEGQALPRKISCWNGCVIPVTATLNTYCSLGGSGAGQRTICACLVYDGTSPTWTACWCWCYFVQEDGGCACARVCLNCNGATVLSQGTSVGSAGGVTNCGTFSTTQNSTTTICVSTKTCAGAGSYEACGRARIEMYCSTINVGGIVVIGSPSAILATSCEYF